MRRTGGQYLDWIRFFFQAEDGIRAGHVTGVQTCALPILYLLQVCSSMYSLKMFLLVCVTVYIIPLLPRSEERRVGKECRSGGRAERCRMKTQAGHRSRWRVWVSDGLGQHRQQVADAGGRV